MHVQRIYNNIGNKRRITWINRSHDISSPGELQKVFNSGIESIDELSVGFFPEIVKVYNYTPFVCSQQASIQETDRTARTRPQRMSGVEEQSFKQSEKLSATKSRNAGCIETECVPSQKR